MNRYIIFLGILQFFFFTQIAFAQDSILYVEEMDFEYLDSKLKLKYEDGIDGFGAKVKLRMKKDSLIWISITKTNIEGVRMLITPEEIHILDRMEKIYTVLTFDSLQSRFQVDLSFDLLQSLIIGNLPFSDFSEDSITIEENFQVIHQKQNRANIHNYINQNTSQLEKLIVADEQTSGVLEWVYSNFSDLNGNSFPNQNDISLLFTSKGIAQQISVSLEHQSIKIPDEPLVFPFKVSDSYTKK